MGSDNILEVGIDQEGRLFIKPEKSKFPLIYRSATEVHWDNRKNILYSPKPREWSYIDWYRYIVTTVNSECGCKLKLTSETIWISIPDTIKQELLVNNSNHIT